MSQKEEEPSLCRFPDPVPPLAINFCPVNLSHARSSLLGQSVIIYPRRAALTTKTPGSLNLFLCVPGSWWLNFCATFVHRFINTLMYSAPGGRMELSRG